MEETTIDLRAVQVALGARDIEIIALEGKVARLAAELLALRTETEGVLLSVAETQAEVKAAMAAGNGAIATA
ncbi:MAG: hypothetical protein Q8Q14_01890 [Gemmatimonadales bacterium]|nr:hypothetical protein [Gemmatimonadales bacterium]